jgi:hypothetical protein
MMYGLAICVTLFGGEPHCEQRGIFPTAEICAAAASNQALQATEAFKVADKLQAAAVMCVRILPGQPA